MKYKNVILSVGFLLAATFLFKTWLFKNIEAPTEFNQVITLQLDKNRGFKSFVKELESKKIIRSSWSSWFYARFFKKFYIVPAGTYIIKPHSSTPKIIQQFMLPQHHWIRIPEGFWINRTARLLEEKNICSAKKYIELTHQPHLFQNKVSFLLPKNSLEGYLYPDTYDFGTNTNPHLIITEQLKEFEKQVIKPLNLASSTFHQSVIIASLIQLEASDPKEKAIIAGILEKRIRRNMRLQLCSTVLYALQTWRPLSIGEAQKVDSPYNTYRHIGLPPNPICSPSVESIKAVLNPISTPYLFFVSAPQDKHFFSKTFDEHVKNIQHSRNLIKNK